MNTVNAFITGALVLIGIYLLFNSQQAVGVINALAGGTARLFGTLQGRTVT